MNHWVRLCPIASNFPNTIEASALFQFPFYRPAIVAKEIMCPVLICPPDVRQENYCARFGG